MVTHSIEELLTAASSKFDILAKRLFTPHGGEIDDLKLIRYFNICCTKLISIFFFINLKRRLIDSYTQIIDST